jgi:3-methyladenine DNA glycosylase AlkD
MTQSYLQPLISRFETARNDSYAAGMKAYLKGQFDYYGITTPVRREILRDHIKMYKLPQKDVFPVVIRDAWDWKERELQYCAMEIFDRYLKKNDEIYIELIEYMVLHKSWWDTVDGIASWLTGTTFKRHPDLIAPCTRRWMDSGNIWLQRCCLLFQLKYREATDTGLLYGFIEELSENKTFWIRKAIGWILREYSKTNPGAVVEFVNSHQLSNLSRKEALKIVGRGSEEGF